MTWLMALIEFLLRTLPVLPAIRLSLEAICDAMLVDLHDAHGRIRRDLDLDALRDIEDQVLGMHPLVDTLVLLASLNASGGRLRSMPTRSHAAPSSIGAPDPATLVRRIREVQNRLRRLQDARQSSSTAQRGRWIGPEVRDGGGGHILGTRLHPFRSATKTSLSASPVLRLAQDRRRTVQPLAILVAHFIGPGCAARAPP